MLASKPNRSVNTVLVVSGNLVRWSGETDVEVAVGYNKDLANRARALLGG